MKEYITNRVHELYWEKDMNCARTTLLCLSELFEVAIEPQIMWSAVGLHGAGGYRAQCGLEFIFIDWEKQNRKWYLLVITLRLLLIKHFIHSGVLNCVQPVFQKIIHPICVKI